MPSFHVIKQFLLIFRFNGLQVLKSVGSGEKIKYCANLLYLPASPFLG